MDRILVVGYDGSEAAQRALDYAAARVNGGRLYVVTAVERPPDWMGAPGWQHAVDAGREQGEKLLIEAVDRLPDAVDYSTELLDRPAAEAIVGVAEARDADEIIVGSRGLGRVRAVLGSVSHDVLHLADRPVVVVPERVGTEEKS